jgi:anti-sigma regulatory factor (Ser/Thr protein kinase)
MTGGDDGGATPIFDAIFDSDTLQALRARVQAHASRVGLPDHRVEDLVLAIHELAANAVRHGAGAGRLRIWDLAGVLRCQVDDGPRASDDEAVAGATHRDDEVKSPHSRGVPSSWSAAPGHGLWVVQQVADRLRVMSGPRGTTAVFIFYPSPDMR